MFGNRDETFKQGDDGAPMPVGRTHRFYRLTVATHSISILVPTGAQFAAVMDNAQAIKIAIGAAAGVVDADGSSIIDTARALAADDGTASRPLRPVTPGEYINISHNDASTAIGAIVLLLEGGGLPATAAALSTSDPEA